MPMLSTPAAVHSGHTSCAMPVTLGIFDDHRVIRRALTDLVSRTPGFAVVCEGDSAEAAVEKTIEFLPNVVLLDISMPGDGVKAVRDIFLSAPAVLPVMITSSDEEHLISEALLAGAHDFVVKGEPAHLLIAALRRVASGSSYISPALAARLLGGPALGVPWTNETPEGTAQLPLVSREQQILTRLSQGLTYSEVAAGIGTDERTVGAFACNILQKAHAMKIAEGV